jgi:hypothetical protein
MPGHESMGRRLGLAAVTVVRCWFGLTWLIGGIACVIWGPLAFADGDGGWFYLLVGGIFLILFGWCTHPWGLERELQPEAETRAPRSWLQRLMR